MIARLNKQVFLVLVCEYVSANVCGVEISVSSYSCTGLEDKILSFDWAASFFELHKHPVFFSSLAFYAHRFDGSLSFESYFHISYTFWILLRLDQLAGTLDTEALLSSAAVDRSA